MITGDSFLLAGRFYFFRRIGGPMFNQRKTPFYLVWTPATGYTRKRHKTAESAQAEAQRLADLNPNLKFHILLAFGYCKAGK
jgi:hypothetical protein